MNQAIDAATGDDGDPLAAVSRYVEAVNRGDPAAMMAECADTMQILDGMAPHVWQGPTASAQWWAAVLVEADHLGTGAYRITLGTPRHVDVTDRDAYVVAPASMAFTLDGHRQVQEGATFTVALRDTEGIWLLTAWSWAKGG